MKFLNTVVSHQIQKNGSNISEKLYLWGTNDKLLSVIADSRETRCEYDGWGNLSKKQRIIYIRVQETMRDWKVCWKSK